MRWIRGIALCAAGWAAALSAAASAQVLPQLLPERNADQATVLSAIGGRPSFSPDGKRIAFVNKTYGDAYEIDIATRHVRKLTGDVPHMGVVRIQYLPDGNFLVTAPRLGVGPNTRAHLEMWVLDKSLQRPMQPLGETVFEGIAVSKKRNLIAWTTIEPALKPSEGWQLGFMKPTKRYMAEIAYRDGVPVLVNKREIMATLPSQCSFIEPQDFHDADSELIYSCMSIAGVGGVTISVMGTKIATNESTVYLREDGRYNEVEGISLDGSWATVECGKQDKPGLPTVDICAVELKPGGQWRRLVVGTSPGSTQDTSNPVVSPDGKWLAFQRSDNAAVEIGEGYGVLLMKIRD